MEVNSVVHQSPNFGMALRIKKTPKTIAALKEQPMEYIQKLGKAGVALKDTNYYHVELKEDLTPKLVSTKSAHFAPFQKGNSDISINDESIYDSLKVGDVFVFRKNNPKMEQVEYKVQSRFGTPLNHRDDIGELADVAIKLDNNAKSYITAKKIEEAELAAKKEQVSNAVDELVDKFSVD